jgi:hypothetical protein
MRRQEGRQKETGMDEGWEALRATPRSLDRSRYRDIPGSMPAKQPCRTGYSPREAVERLLSRGVSGEEARRLVDAAVGARAEEVVKSWAQWVARHGFLDEMPRLSPGDLAELKKREKWDDLLRDVALVTIDPANALSSPEVRTSLSDRASRLNRRDASHPAVFVLERLHGLPPSLAEAATLRSATVPGWAFAAIAAFTLACALLSAGSLVSLLTGGGIGALRVFLPTLLFGAFFGFAFRFLWRDRDRRERAWRDRLADLRPGPRDEG